MPSAVEKPGIECEPARTAISRPSLRASSIASTTSAVPAQLTMTAGSIVSNMRVPDLARVVVALVAGGEHGAADRLAQLGDLAAGQGLLRHG